MLCFGRRAQAHIPQHLHTRVQDGKSLLQKVLDDGRPQPADDLPHRVHAGQVACGRNSSLGAKPAPQMQVHCLPRTWLAPHVHTAPGCSPYVPRSYVAAACT